VLPTGLPGDIFPALAAPDAQGRYALGGLGPYRWPVRYSAGYSDPVAWQWSGGTANRYDAYRVRVTAGQATTEDFQVAPAGTLTGRILHPDGSVFTDPVTIQTYNAVTGDLAAPVAYGANGTFTISGLTTEDIKIQYEAGLYPDGFSGPAFDDTAPIRVRLGADTSYDLILTR